MPIFATSGDVLENTVLASGFFVATWIVMLSIFGTYERHVFGAGTGPVIADPVRTADAFRVDSDGVL